MLERLASGAEEYGVKLGIENRQALEELPLDSDMELLLREFDRPGIGYWHDCGHAQIKENLGFIDHRRTLGIPVAPLAVVFMCMTWRFRDTTIAPRAMARSILPR